MEKSKYKYPLLAKPSGITLDQHRQDVIAEGKLLTSCYPFVLSKYQSLVGKNLKRRIELAARFHDDGKKHEKWQRACQMDYEAYLNWRKTCGGDFREYASKNRNDAGKNLRKAEIRHEFQSLALNQRKNLPICIQVAIAAHHTKLGFKHEDRWVKEGVSRFWKTFQKEGNRVIDEGLELSQVAKLQYEFAGPRGLLQLADHRASAIEDGDFVPNYTPFKYQFPHSGKRNVQKLIEQFWQDDLLLVRAPTGAGKTDASLLWASKQIKNGRADRLVIAMPTRFTSNALAINVSENLSDTGLYHSSAWFTNFKQGIDAGKIDEKEANKIHEFARLLQTPITVCTIDHLLMALTLTREDQHLITFNMANCCLVIDEADFYDDFSQSNILVLLEVLRYWKVPILLMSASLPESVLNDYQKIGYQVKNIKEDKSDIQEHKRPRFKIKSIKSYSASSEVETLLKLCLEKGNAIIYVNTVDRAVEFINWFEDKKIDTCLYHSRFTEPDKKRKEETLIKMLGREAWEKDNAQGVAILTQIGEMSINISADIMLSELCPIDRLIQRAGRLCRFDNSKIGEMHVLIPEKNENLYPAPYGNFDRTNQVWEPSKALIETMKALRCEPYSAEKLVILLNSIYSSTNEFSTKAIANAKNLKDYFRYNWLINSKQISRKDDTGVNFWKSRNILPQETVFIGMPESTYFNNYLSYQNWKIHNSLELPVYLVEKGKKNYMIDLKDISIKNEKQTICVIREGFYSFKKGAVLNISTHQII